MGDIERTQQLPATDKEVESRGLKRRTVIKGAAWSIPVIAGAVAVPASAASGSALAPVSGGEWTSQYSGTGQFDLTVLVDIGNCASFAATVVDYTLTMKNGRTLTASTSMVNPDMDFYVSSSRPGIGVVMIGGQAPAVLLAEFDQLVVTLNVTDNCGGPTGIVVLQWSALRSDQNQPQQSDGTWLN